MPMPVLAEISTASEASRPITSSICSLTRSGSAAGRSILLRTGDDLVVVVDRLVDIGERLRLDALEASTTSSEPSQAASERDTS